MSATAADAIDPAVAAAQAELARLRAEAEAAEAQLKAAQARAALAAAEAAALQAALPPQRRGSGGAAAAPIRAMPRPDRRCRDRPRHATASTETAANPPIAAPAIAGPLDAEQIAAVVRGYTFEAATLDLGALQNGDPVPEAQIRIPLAMMNRHGLVAGATGTGKTRTLQGLAEQLASNGVPVFAADIKGDLSGVATPGEANEKLLARTRAIGQDWKPAASVTEYFALGGIGKGIPVRATVTGFGPLLLSKVLGLNQTQESSLGLVFHYADREGLPLVDLSDLRAVLTYLTSDDGKAELEGLGGLSKATAGVILRELITFADGGADVFFGEPEFSVKEFIRTAPDGRGVISLLEVPGRRRQARALLHLPDVPAGRALRAAARGGGCRQAQARVLLRRGAPAVQGRVQGLPLGDHADRPAHPLEGRRRVLRDADAEGRALRRARPARIARAARPPRLHTRRREGAPRDRGHLSEVRATTSSARCRSSAPARRSSR